MGKYTPEQVGQYMNYVRQNFGSKYTPEQMAQYEGYVRSNFADSSAGEDSAPASASGFRGDPHATQLPQQPTSPALGELENPISMDLYGSVGSGADNITDEAKGDAARVAASFGNVAGNTPTLLARGAKGVQKNKAGDLVIQGPDGKFYKDNAGWRHPINWLESKVGGALPTAGMMLGGAAAGAAAAPETLGTGSIPAAVAGAGAGGAAGEGARIAVGKALGTYKGDASDVASDVAGEGVGSAAAELGGKVIGKVPIPGTGMNIDAATKAGLEKLVSGTKGVLTKMSGALTDKDAAAYLRLMDRPNQVGKALRPGNTLAVSRAAQDELAGRAGSEDALISQARKTFAEKYGREPINTDEMQKAVTEFQQANALNTSGHSGMTQGELDELQGLKDNDLSTTRQTAPEVRASEINPRADFSRGVVIDRGPEFQVQPAAQVTEPVKGAGELQKTADWLQQQVTPSAYNTNLPTTRSAKSVGAYQRLLGLLKDSFHKMDPEGLGKADARFSDYAGKAKLLGPIENDATGESFAANLFGKNKGARQEAAQELIPRSYEDMADIGAAKHLKGPGPISKVGPSVAGSVPLVMGAAGLGASGGNPIAGLLGVLGGTATVAATTPSVHALGYKLAGKYVLPGVNMLARNPQLLPALLDSTGARQSAWSLMNKLEGNNGQKAR